MEYTQQNLLRVGDIIAEIAKTLASLKRQAQKAESYKRYRAEIRELELWVASHRWFELTGEQRVLREQLGAASASADGARVALRMREAELEAERLDLQLIEADVDSAQTASYEADNSVKLLESQIAHHGEQAAQLKEREHAAAADVKGIAEQRQIVCCHIGEIWHHYEILIHLIVLSELVQAGEDFVILFKRQPTVLHKFWMPAVIEVQRRQAAGKRFDQGVGTWVVAARGDVNIVLAQNLCQFF